MRCGRSSARRPRASKREERGRQGVQQAAVPRQVHEQRVGREYLQVEETNPAHAVTLLETGME